MQKRDVLFLCQFFYPEYNSSATLPWDTAKYLAKSGLSVGAVCGYPKEYNNIGKVPNEEDVDNVHIKRFHYIQLKRGKKLARLINYFSFTFTILLHIGELRKYKSVIVYTNPPILPVAAILGNILFGTKIVSVSYDVYPEVAYASGQLSENGIISKAMQIINRSLIQHLSAVVALTDEMKDFLLTHRKDLSIKKIKVIPNWAHESKRKATSEALSRYGYTENDFIVSYFGNMGICQDMETLLYAMEALKNENHIKFFIVGHGGKKGDVKNRTKDLKNVQILDYLTGKDFEQAVSISSCSIVSLERGLKGMCAPSKYYSYLQGGIPVIAIVENGSYLEKEVEKESIGKAVNVGDGPGLVRIITELASDNKALNEMAYKAENLYQKKYAIEIGLGKYLTLVKGLVNK